MKIITLILGLFLLPHALSAQGFNQLEKFDFDGADYSNFIVANDTISIFGSFINNNGEEEGLYFQKLDSFGQVITEKTFVHPTKLYWAATRRQGFIKLKNHLGYAILGNFYQKQEGYILRLDEDGNFLSLKEYPKPPTFRTASWMYLKETESGLLVGTTYQLDNYDLTNFLYKMDYDGNIIWSIELGTSVEDFISDVVVKNEDEYIVASVLMTDFQNTSLNQNGTQFWRVDSSGQIISYWAQQADDSEGGARNVQVLGNGDLVYHTEHYYKYLNVAYFYQAKMVRRTANYDLVWEQLYGAPAEEFNRSAFRDMKPLPGGGYAAVGFLRKAGMTNQNAYMIRTDENGILEWERFDTAHVDDQWTAVGFLSTGSIIACGYTNNYNDLSTYSWLIKVSPDGCVDEFNCAVVGAPAQPLPTDIGHLRVFPNPARDMVQVSYPPRYKRGHWQLWDMYGREVWSGQEALHTGAATVPLAGLPSGNYTLTVRTGKEVWQARVLKVE